ncbi:hypothetical protein [Burkholderia cepacia]|uniref:hypothetical protein n=1 Tax=Burkholderia cepacia TaxID=292 RepID=UPI0011BD5902|nr:hypothetical protein [Burkholderia cepacia]MCE4129856.1 hypothetical protein [Burkholderia cepacia]MDN7856288.1 hypothetical protein [Burkholderia cepacia]
MITTVTCVASEHKESHRPSDARRLTSPRFVATATVQQHMCILFRPDSGARRRRKIEIETSNVSVPPQNVDFSRDRRTFDGVQRGSRRTVYVEALPELEAWYRNAAKETTDIGVDRASIRGIGTGHRGETNGPLAAYNAWANAQLVKLIRGVWHIASFASVSGFETWHALLLESAEAYWEMRRYPALPRS